MVVFNLSCISNVASSSFWLQIDFPHIVSAPEKRGTYIQWLIDHLNGTLGNNTEKRKTREYRYMDFDEKKNI